MPAQKKSYHHGDLHQTLIDAATHIIREQGVAALSIRKLADHVGVSRGAPYHHFKDKVELLCAIAEEGYHMQDDIINLLGSRNSEHSSRQRFEVFVMSYIRFAREHPEHYDLMYSGEIWKNNQPTESLQSAGNRAFKMWCEQIERFQKDGTFPASESTARVAQVAWATLHGLCRFSIDGIYLDSSNLEEMGHCAVNMMTASHA